VVSENPNNTSGRGLNSLTILFSFTTVEEKEDSTTEEEEVETTEAKEFEVKTNEKVEEAAEMTELVAKAAVMLLQLQRVSLAEDSEDSNENLDI